MGASDPGPVDQNGRRHPPQEGDFDTYFPSTEEFGEGIAQCSVRVDSLNRSFPQEGCPEEAATIWSVA
jgi:hypothetical protein